VQDPDHRRSFKEADLGCARLASRGMLLAIAVLASACGSSPRAGQMENQPITGASHVHPIRHAPPIPVVATGTDSVTIHLAGGRQLVEARLREPGGVILLYQLRAPRGTALQGTTQLPLVSAPLYIRTTKLGPTSSCGTHRSKVICTVGEEWCPMPAGVWHVRINKYSGPPGYVTIRFRVGEPPASYRG
jgi:hypothetical protein